MTQFAWKIEKHYYGDEVEVWASCFVDKKTKLCTNKVTDDRENEAEVFREILNQIDRAEEYQPDKAI